MFRVWMFCLGLLAPTFSALPQTFVWPISEGGNGHTYLLSPTGSWYDAKQFGESVGGYLVCLETATEDAWVFSTFGSLLDYVECGYWIGCTDELVEGQWHWVNNAPFSYANWAPGEPNNDSFGLEEEYGTVWGPSHSGVSGRWNDMTVLCSRYLQSPIPIRGVIEIESVPPPLCNGDADGDQDRDFADITAVLAAFGATYSSTGPGDANHNGVVNFADVTEVLATFGTPCPQ